MTQKELAIKWFNENTKTSHRNNQVGISWYILDNSQLLDLGIAPNKFENWSDMFRQDDDNSIKESYYLNDIFRMFFGNPNTNVFSNQTEENQRTLKKLVKTIQGKMDTDADTIVYTPVGNKIHTIVKDMLENVADHHKYDIYIMDGGTDDRKGTSNRECESEMKKHSEEARTKNPKNPKHCIFISSLMGTRSWSNKYVKNVILLYNNGSFDTNSQRIARGFTPWAEHGNCTIFDFRMTYDSPTVLEEYLVGMLENKQYFSGDKIEWKIENIIESSDKISFFNFYKDLKSPFKELTKDEIIKMIKCNISFRRTRLINNIKIDDIAVPKNDINYKMISSITSTNIKGDSEKVIKKNLSVEAKKIAKGKTSKEEIDKIMLKIKYIDFVNNYGYILNFDSFEENILNQICEHIDEYRDAPHFEDVLWFDTIKDILFQMQKMQIGNEFDNIFIWQ